MSSKLELDLSALSVHRLQYLLAAVAENETLNLRVREEIGSRILSEHRAQAIKAREVTE